MTTLGVLVPLRPGAPAGPPEDLPMGRAALLLAEEGLAVVFGADVRDGRMTGLIARPGRWEPVTDVPVVAAYDRYPSKADPAGHAALRAGLGTVPLANPYALTLLCRDKLACQRHLEARGVSMPEVEGDPSRFAERLSRWGAAFVKPRHGAFGEGVRRVVRPPAVTEPSVLQRAVRPPEGWAGVSVRALVQRERPTWVTCPPVARRHRTDPVVNVARGAETAALADVLPELLAEVEAKAIAVAEALADHPDGAWLVELGVDLVIGADGHAHVIEVNSRPRGRLEALAAQDPGRWTRAHLDACARPLRCLRRLAR